MKNKSVELNVKVDRTEIDEAIKTITELKAKLESLPTGRNVIKKVTFNKLISEIAFTLICDLKGIVTNRDRYVTNPEVKLQVTKELAGIIYTLEKTRALYDASSVSDVSYKCGFGDEKE